MSVAVIDRNSVHQRHAQKKDIHVRHSDIPSWEGIECRITGRISGMVLARMSHRIKPIEHPRSRLTTSAKHGPRISPPFSAIQTTRQTSPRNRIIITAVSTISGATNPHIWRILHQSMMTRLIHSMISSITGKIAQAASHRGSGIIRLEANCMIRHPIKSQIAISPKIPQKRCPLRKKSSLLVYQSWQSEA